MNLKEQIIDLLESEYTGKTSSDTRAFAAFMWDNGYLNDLKTTKRLVKYCYSQLMNHGYDSLDAMIMLSNCFHKSPDTIRGWIYRK